MRELIASDPAETLTYRWLETGAGVPVILIHGIPTSPELWRSVVPLVTGARLVAWEMVGYGRSWSQGVGADISVKAQAGHLIRWLDEVEIDKAVLVGHDLGGGVVQIAAIRRPERVRGIVLCNSIAYDSWPIPSVKAMRALGGRLERMPPSMFRRLFAFVISQGHDDSDRAASRSRRTGPAIRTRTARPPSSDRSVRFAQRTRSRSPIGCQRSTSRRQLCGEAPTGSRRRSTVAGSPATFGPS